MQKEYCLFIIYTEKECKIEKKFKSDSFWETKMGPQLKKFFEDHFLPALVRETKKN
jgi:hypothetical protein